MHDMTRAGITACYFDAR